MAIKSAMSNSHDCSSGDSLSSYCHVRDRNRSLRQIHKPVNETEKSLDAVENIYKFLDGLQSKSQMTEKIDEFLKSI